MSFKVERATFSDAAALADLSAKTFVDNFGYLYKPEDLQGHLDKFSSQNFFEASLATDVILVVRDRLNPLGLIAYTKLGKVGLPVADAHPDARELHRIYIDKPYQDQGLGGLMMNEILSLDMMRDAPKIYVGVWENNFKAQRFYARYGFKPIGEYLYYVGQHTDRELILERANRNLLR